MKILVELDLDNPTHQQLFDQLRGQQPQHPPMPSPFPQPTQQMPRQSQLPPNTASHAQNQLPPMPGQQPQNPPMPSPPMPSPPMPSPQVQPTQQSPPPTQQPMPQGGQPTIDRALPLDDQLQQAMATLYAQLPKEGQKLSAEMRQQYGMDMPRWSEDQKREALSRFEALLRF